MGGRGETQACGRGEMGVRQGCVAGVRENEGGGGGGWGGGGGGGGGGGILWCL